MYYQRSFFVCQVAAISFLRFFTVTTVTFLLSLGIGIFVLGKLFGMDMNDAYGYDEGVNGVFGKRHVGAPVLRERAMSAERFSSFSDGEES